MPVNQKINEAGWFYHAPAKKNTNPEKIDPPAPSQIPGIGFDDPTLLEKEEVRPMMFKETDSKYIQLAKMGGRKDLLSFNPAQYKKKQQGPAGYPRNEWFYLEDNRVEDEEQKKKESWDFLLPDYMVHKSYQPSFEDPSSPPIRGGAPYHTEKGSILECEGRSATDKTVRIPEIRRPGFGVRNEKPPPVIKSIPRDKGARSQEAKGDHRRKQNQINVLTESDEPTMMSKLLAGGYEKDWHDKHADVAAKEEESKTQNKKPNLQPSATGQKNLNNSQPNRGALEEKALFKLSKFKDVPARITMHQSSHVAKANAN